ncbi:MAG TPA: cytochrome c family protein [Caulobacterales bacterium]|nr:cytochrome c family protein [Caulobacterales bacterium]
MSDLRVNTIAGAVLGSFMAALGLRIVGEDLFAPKFPEKPGYDIDISAFTGAGGGGAAPAEQAGPVDWGLILGDPAQVAAGEKVVAKCESCHTFTKGGESLIGPNQWNLVGRVAGSQGGFNYSPAMKAFAKPWTYDELDGFIQNPTAHVKGTMMSFVGVKKAEDRHALIAYLRTRADSPAPIPAALPPKAETPPPASATPPSP